MGKFLKSIGGVFGLGSAAVAPQAPAPAPVPVEEPVKEVQDTKDAVAKKARATLYETAGGAAGEELSPDQVKRRSTLFGN